ncbi:hypothetical protein EKG37_03810 [Robertmurraya yapensis]|uniref:Uncharacterized protein n=2 Tax=Bacillaceae TaxID=186817 RepID=A0A3S0J153_9BACI|nr:hypothetical protein [Bacillus yapensis]RTR35768.1 hypothetical protein EKG37_03810 [Bacillus yapensis]TKS98570.1 hypothetical protein FAR12_03810 [Bacillus yapensis]
MDNQSLENHYTKDLLPIDEQICVLLKKRKVFMMNNTEYPTEEMIINWAKNYDFFEDYLKAIFGTIRMEKYFKPRIEPTVFRKYLPVQKFVENKGLLYSVTTIRQYENASLVQLNIDGFDMNESLSRSARNYTFGLFIGEQYDCQLQGGGGSTGHYTINFVVSPPLPDECSGTELVFKEYTDTFAEKPTGLEIIIQID